MRMDGCGWREAWGSPHCRLSMHVGLLASSLARDLRSNMGAQHGEIGKVYTFGSVDAESVHLRLGQKNGHSRGAVSVGAAPCVRASMGSVTR